MLAYQVWLSVKQGAKSRASASAWVFVYDKVSEVKRY